MLSDAMAPVVAFGKSSVFCLDNVAVGLDVMKIKILGAGERGREDEKKKRGGGSGRKEEKTRKEGGRERGRERKRRERRGKEERGG
jgi:hypothetical protein